VIFGDLNEEKLVEFSEKNNVEMGNLKTAIDILMRDDVIELKNGYYNVKRTKAFS